VRPSFARFNGCLTPGPSPYGRGEQGAATGARFVPALTPWYRGRAGEDKLTKVLDDTYSLVPRASRPRTPRDESHIYGACHLCGPCIQLYSRITTSMSSACGGFFML